MNARTFHSSKNVHLLLHDEEILCVSRKTYKFLHAPLLQQQRAGIMLLYCVSPVGKVWWWARLTTRAGSGCYWSRWRTETRLAAQHWHRAANCGMLRAQEGWHQSMGCSSNTGWFGQDLLIKVTCCANTRKMRVRKSSERLKRNMIVLRCQSHRTVT
jgi:hypothetical protein